MPEWLGQWLQQPVNSAEGAITHGQLLKYLGTAFILGCLVAGIHQATRGRRGRTDRSFLATLVLLSLLIALVTQAIGNNLALAFSLAGALSIIRFRTVVEDTRDTAFIIFAVVSGMAAGKDFAIGPILGAPLVLLAAWVLRPARDEAPAREGTLILRLAVGRTPDERLEALLKKHLAGHQLIGLSTARGGSALDVTYSIRLPAPEQSFALVNELSRLEGVQGVEVKGG
jgi:hypothetical protein